MPFADAHRESQQLAMDAAVAAAAGNYPQAESLYLRAGEAEAGALRLIDVSKTRTIGIAVVSAVSLLYKGKAFDRAQKLATDWLSRDGLPAFATSQIRDLLQTIWGEQYRIEQGINFVGHEILVSLKGGDVIFGGAPLNLIVDKVEEVRKLFIRVAEYINQKPLRKSGNPTQEILRDYRPFILQTAPGSYQFAVRMQAPAQIEEFAANEPRAAEVSKKFLDIMKATASGPDAMEKTIPEADYRKTFMQLTRELAPDGARVREISFSGTISPAEPEAVLSSSTRQEITTALKRASTVPQGTGTREIEYVGTLRALDLDKDWLEVTLPDKERQFVYGVGDTVDDVIGPMVNREVIVRATVTAAGVSNLQDIQLKE
jgi:hypothetical protein